jgi:hypothetical protein
MFAVLDAVETYAGETAEGAVNFDTRAIELAFSLCHETQSEAQRKVADVFSLIETHTPVAFGASEASVRHQGREERLLTLC